MAASAARCERWSGRARRGSGAAWVGRGRLGSPRRRRLKVTPVIAWTTGQEQPWAVVTGLPPARVGVSWYAPRLWVEPGFRALKGVGWRWGHTRRADPRRVARGTG